MSAGRGAVEIDPSKTILKRIPVPQRVSWKPPDNHGHLGMARVSVWAKNDNDKWVRKFVTFSDSVHGGSEFAIDAAVQFHENRCDCDGRILD